ncbi:hypothetical protein A7U43_05325 [Mycobacterium adipatum]|uniref:TNT domain-containing protein n=1 Tax=Mycobacterium adipatum TaxID=1682113 RepID=A0A172UIH2_9MYCO|nr:TNT domain-containing protein [Mycobacterium adipatum]ANE78828.1 hypothetical protein A7U43_05325 [Mycobacterium adipatum]MBI5736590.1 TNT domain-containing protein [Mycolicibacterium neoaurum]
MRIEVEPQALIDAGKQVGALGAQLGALSDAMGQMLAGGIASGTDPAGLNFGISYGRQADDVANYLAQLANAYKGVGRMLEATGFNYQHADQASAAGGSGPSGAVSGEQAETKPGDTPYTSVTGYVPPPPGWAVIQPFLTMVPFLGVALTWPSGNSGMMNVTAAQWANIARGLRIFEPALQSAAMAAGAQDVPEAGQMTKALKDLGDGANTLAGIAGDISTAITDFAKGVQETQDAIRDLLDRLSFGGIWDSVTGMLSGEGGNILREIADDVGTVLENFQNQVQGVLGLLSELQNLLREAAEGFQKWIRPVLVGAFGDSVGNELADAVRISTSLQAGLGVAVIGLVSGTVALADPDTWKGLADTAIIIAKDPTKIDDVLKQSGSEFIAWDVITGDNPALGVGEALGNIGSLFIPGGALAKGGSVAKGLAATRRLLDGEGLEGLGRIPGLGGNRTPDMPELPDAPGAPNIPEFTPPPGIPGSVLGPGGPTGSTASAPSSPGSGSGGGPAATVPSPNGSGPSQPGGRAGPGSPSSSGPAPTGGSPNPGGSSGGPSSGGTVPTGGSPSPDGGDGPSRPSGGGPLSPSISSSTDSQGSPGASQSTSGPSPAGGGDGPGSQTLNGGGSSHTSGSPNSEGSSNSSSDDRLSPEPDAGQKNPDFEASSSSQSGGGAGSSGTGSGSGSGSEDGGSDAGGASGTHEGKSEATGADSDGSNDRDLSDPPSSDDTPPALDTQPKVAGIDYALPAEDAIRILSDPAAEIQRLADGGVPASVLDGYDPLAGREPADFRSEFGTTDQNGNLAWDWQNQAPNNGFAGDPVESDSIPSGHQLDRLGFNGGGFMADEGAPMAERAMAPGAAAQYHTFEGTGRPVPDGKDWVVQHGPAKSAFGQPGGAEQWVVIDNKTGYPVKVEDLIRARMLRETTP